MGLYLPLSGNDASQLKNIQKNSPEREPFGTFNILLPPDFFNAQQIADDVGKGME